MTGSSSSLRPLSPASEYNAGGDTVPEKTWSVEKKTRRASGLCKASASRRASGWKGWRGKEMRGAGSYLCLRPSPSPSLTQLTRIAFSGFLAQAAGEDMAGGEEGSDALKGEMDRSRGVLPRRQAEPLPPQFQSLLLPTASRLVPLPRGSGLYPLPPFLPARCITASGLQAATALCRLSLSSKSALRTKIEGRHRGGKGRRNQGLLNESRHFCVPKTSLSPLAQSLPYRWASTWSLMGPGREAANGSTPFRAL